MSKKIAVLYRTHIVNEPVLEGYRHLVKHAPEDVDVFFCCDETAGLLDVPDGVRKHSHTTADAERLGLLPYDPDRLLWYSGDYPLYFFYTDHPDYDMYVMVEFDVYFTDVALKAFYAHLVSADTDLHCAHFRETHDRWRWKKGAEEYHDKVYMAFFAIIGLSNKVVQHMFAKRRAFTKQFQAGAKKYWSFCEAFIPSEAMAASFRVDQLGDTLHMRLGRFSPANLFYYGDMKREADTDEILHPVLSGTQYVAKLVGIAGSGGVPAFLRHMPRHARSLAKLDPALLDRALDQHVPARDTAAVMELVQQAKEKLATSC